MIQAELSQNMQFNESAYQDERSMVNAHIGAGVTPTILAKELAARISDVKTVEVLGRVTEAYGTVIRVSGLSARIGDLCHLRDPHSGQVLQAEVVGLAEACALLTPLGSLTGISAQTEVSNTYQQHTITVGHKILGRILDANAAPIDGLGAITGDTQIPVYRDTPNPIERPLIEETFTTGITAVDTLLSCGQGQRVGIFAMAGAGKSTLLGMLARGSSADINVIALVGERGREVNEFIADCLNAETRRKTVIIVATSDRPALERAKAAYVATAIAEYFRDQGKNVLLLVDSVTRFARALRDVGLSVGEPPVRRGFPPSVFSALPSLFERAGRNRQGSITAFYAVLVEEEDMVDPIAEETRSILDGHIHLSKKLAAVGHYPAIDILSSTSRLMNRLVDASQAQVAVTARKHLAKYQEIELLLQIGEYKSGSDPDADEAIRVIKHLRETLKQASNDTVSLQNSWEKLHGALQ